VLTQIGDRQQQQSTATLVSQQQSATIASQL